ncbi:MAG: phosphoenolpyruvate carboxylase [Halobacteriovoraceae bacterium]|nr:phosphoenolpyruvate carboxylase [Halobacteriovoraceae bacterium]
MRRLPKELKELISWSVEILGDTISAEYGQHIFKEIENIRLKMKSLRGEDYQSVYRSLMKVSNQFSKMDSQELEKISHAFSLMLELINRCENAYRTYRLSHKKDQEFKKIPYAIIFVLTAHPTEARGQEMLRLFDQIENYLTDFLLNPKIGTEKKIRHLIRLTLKMSLSRSEKPQVFDEAENIFSYALRGDIIHEIVELGKANIPVYLRTWVGGDKDGHPGVDNIQLLKSLNLSRKYLLKYFTTEWEKACGYFELFGNRYKKNVSDINKLLGQIKTVAHADGRKILELREMLSLLDKDYKKQVGEENPRIRNLQVLLWHFPALVLTLELREDSEIVKDSLKNENAINKMLETIYEISEGFNPKWYARGLVLSMVEDSIDIENGIKLVKKIFGEHVLPVVPLFENEKALKNSVSILDQVFNKNKTLASRHLKLWGGRFEVMLGYSDSSKENGVLPSRILINSSLNNLEKFFKKKGLTPVYFHGSGGSVARGGGSLKEQISWWPPSAVNIFKVTVQGEMVARNFANAKIFKRQIDYILNGHQFAENSMIEASKRKLLEEFAADIQVQYRNLIQREDFYQFVQETTPYEYLHLLKIGSRPSKRGGDARNKLQLRAIPWILCWTQCRLLLPTWWGIGSTWENLNPEKKKQMKNVYADSRVFYSFVKLLGFTLAKVDLGVWKVYVESSDLSDELKEIYSKLIISEFKKTVEFFFDITKENEFLWFRRWLQESINFRSSMIHPLNLIQIEALRRKDAKLIRETVTGIACGMLTTG